MKSILISIKPKWVAKILNGEKTIEIRKTMPKCDLPIDVYIYCTKDKETLVKFDEDIIFKSYAKHIITNSQKRLNGKVVAKFTLKRVEEIAYQRVFEQNPFHFLKEESGYGTETLNANEFKRETCLDDKELKHYLNTDKPNKKGYAWHIDNLVIFDEPKELSEFEHEVAIRDTVQGYSYEIQPVHRVNDWCYIESEENE